MKRALYELNWGEANEIERGEAESLLASAKLLAKDRRVSEARAAHHGSFTSESYDAYQAALNGAADTYFTPVEARRVLFNAPLGNDAAKRNLSRALLNEDLTYQAGPVREALWRLHQEDVMRSFRKANKHNG